MSLSNEEVSKKVSAKLGEFLLQGHTMLNAYCIDCNTVLMRGRDKKEHCVHCDDLALRNRVLKEQESASSSSTGTDSRATTPAAAPGSAAAHASPDEPDSDTDADAADAADADADADAHAIQKLMNKRRRKHNRELADATPAPKPTKSTPLKPANKAPQAPEREYASDSETDEHGAGQRKQSQLKASAPLPSTADASSAQMHAIADLNKVIENVLESMYTTSCLLVADDGLTLKDRESFLHSLTVHNTTLNALHMTRSKFAKPAK